PDALTEPKRISARQGILGHVVTTGRPYVIGDRSQGELIAELAQTIGPIGPIGPILWCFAINQGTQRLGAVTAGQLDIVPADNLALLRAVEQLVAQCWCLLAETVHSRTAGQDDPGSGLYNRSAFLQAAQQSLRESYAQGEPVAIAVIAVEGIRELNDAGRWEVADELVREVADSLRRKVRMDDRLGRFDGSRFIWLLRRVDAELASLIVKQVMSSAFGGLCGPPQADNRWSAFGGSIAVRCGVVGSGTENPDLRTLVSQALVQSRRARLEHVTIAGELDAQAATTVGAG
ncbi:MAG: diguanylate cyclase, partial [Planctomycetota bacterium]